MTDLCPVCNGTDIDDYGCMDCFMNAAASSLPDEDWSEEE